MTPLIPEATLKAVCKLGHGSETCRYIVGDERGICCAKHELQLRLLIDRRVADDDFTAQGDNCEGLRYDS